MAPAGDVEDVTMLSDEEYLVFRAREILKQDPYAARAWMLTAKCLFPQNFNIQFEAYNIEKATKHVKEAARCFSTIFQQFEHEPQLWQEVQLLTFQGSGDPDTAFLKEMFSHIPQEVQQSVLVATADRSEDTMEQCRLLLLLLRKFPHTAPHHAPKLVELLLAAERHCTAPVNLYRQFLVCQVLPLIGQNKNVQLPPKLLFRLLHKAIDFYCSFLVSPSKPWPDEEGEGGNGVSDPWQGLFSVQELLGQKLGWTLSSPSPNTVNKEAYWQKLRHFAQTRSLDSSAGSAASEVKELVYCSTTLMLLCLHEYSAALSGTLAADGSSSGPPTSSQQDPQLVLVEAFVGDASTDDGPSTSKRSRRTSTEEERNTPTISVSAQANEATRQSLVQTLLLAARTWDLLHATEHTKREFARLQQVLRLTEGPWLRIFLEDESLLRGRSNLSNVVASTAEGSSNASLVHSLRLASTAMCQGRFVETSLHAMDAVASLPLTPAGQLSGGLRRKAPSGRHLHFLALTRLEVLQYCSKLLITCLQRVLGSHAGETALGHCLVLLQLDWPQEQELATLLLEQVRSSGRLSYAPFSRYVVNIDLLEELMFLTSEQGGRVTLDILPASSSQLPSQRRMATRGVDKGAKEDFRQAMRRQVARGSENIESLVQQFLTNERTSLLQVIAT